MGCCSTKNEAGAASAAGDATVGAENPQLTAAQKCWKLWSEGKFNVHPANTTEQRLEAIKSITAAKLTFVNPWHKAEHNSAQGSFTDGDYEASVNLFDAIAAEIEWDVESLKPEWSVGGTDHAKCVLAGKAKNKRTNGEFLDFGYTIKFFSDEKGLMTKYEWVADPAMQATYDSLHTA